MAGASATTFSEIKADFKEVYSDDGIVEILPDHCHMQRMAPFNTRPIGPGKEYVEPVRVQRPSGWTFENSGAGAYDKNVARAGKLVDARITANNMHLIEVIDKETVHRAHAEGKEAFKSATSLVVEAMAEAFRNQKEVNLLHGQTELGLIDVGGAAAGPVVTIADKEWAAAIWMGAEGGSFDFYDAAGATFITTAMLVSVDTDLRKLTFDRDVVALGVLQGHAIWRSGTKTPGGTKEAAGLMKVLKNTGSIFNVNAALYTLWQASKQDVAGGTASLANWIKLSGKCCIKGLKGGSVGFTSVESWNNMATDEAAFRRYAEGLKGKIEVGLDGLVFVGASGAMVIKPHAMMKKGYSILLNLSAGGGKKGGDFKRIGAAEMSFEGDDDDNNLIYLPDVAGYQVELYSNESLLVDPPGRSGYMTNVIPT